MMLTFPRGYSQTFGAEPCNLIVACCKVNTEPILKEWSIIKSMDIPLITFIENHTSTIDVKGGGKLRRNSSQDKRARIIMLPSMPKGEIIGIIVIDGKGETKEQHCRCC